jgi:peptidoglycan/LPS O-acetylase OafA/YrhL
VSSDDVGSLSSGGGATSPLSRPHVPALDGLRGVAILAIMVLHFGEMCAHQTTVQRAWHVAISPLWMGVDLFFVLSGFLITRILLWARGKPGFFVNFYGRRTVRIFPLYYGVLLAIFVAMPLIRPDRPSPELRAQQIWFWTYLSNFRMAWTGKLWPGDAIRVNHFWSLAVEEQFYLIWPTIVYLLDERSLRRMCMALIAITPVARAIAILGFHCDWAVVFGMTPFRMDTLCYGALVAVLSRDQGAMDRVRAWAPWVVGFCIAGLAILFGVRGGLDSGEPVVQLVAYTLTGPLFAGVIVWSLAKPAVNAFTSAMESRWLMMLGKYSYGLYVYHYLLMPQYLRIFGRVYPLKGGQMSLPQTFAYEIFGGGCALAISVASYHLYEAQFLKIKRYFTSRPASDNGALAKLSEPAMTQSE